MVVISSFKIRALCDTPSRHFLLGTVCGAVAGASDLDLLQAMRKCVGLCELASATAMTTTTTTTTTTPDAETNNNGNRSDLLSLCRRRRGSPGGCCQSSAPGVQRSVDSRTLKVTIAAIGITRNHNIPLNSHHPAHHYGHYHHHHHQHHGSSSRRRRRRRLSHSYFCNIYNIGVQTRARGPAAGRPTDFERPCGRTLDGTGATRYIEWHERPQTSDHRGPPTVGGSENCFFVVLRGGGKRKRKVGRNIPSFVLQVLLRNNVFGK